MDGLPLNRGVSLQHRPEDVPSPIDLRRMDDAREWSEAAMVTRPWRTAFFVAFAAVIRKVSGGHPCRILELGSGPGFLIEHVLGSQANISYVALDFSPAMHELAKHRLGSLTKRVQFIERSFRETNWSTDLGRFDFVVTLQAVHELRHKRHAQTLHAQVRQVLRSGGSYLVCDHYCGADGMSNDQLYMSVQEQRDTLMRAGFHSVEQVLLRGGLVLHQAT